MKHLSAKLLAVLTIMSMLVSFLPAMALTETPAPASLPVPGAATVASLTDTPAPTVARRSPVAIGAFTLQNPHLRPPREEVVIKWLQESNAIPLNATEEQLKAAVNGYYKKFFERNDSWVPPKIAGMQLQREEDLANPKNIRVLAVQPITANVFGLAVDFGATEEFTLPMEDYDEQGNRVCVTQTIVVTGPLAGNVPHPNERDNNTIWYSPTLVTDPKFYEKLAFGYEGVGRTRFDLTDPDDGLPGINLAGYTVQDYYDHVAGPGNVYVTGTIEGWVTVNHSQAYYGANDCENTGSIGGYIAPIGQLVVDALDVFSATHPTYYTDTSADAFWKRFDGDGDGVVDTTWIFYAGVGEEAGGGMLGTLALWSHSWALSSQGIAPYKVYEGDPTTENDDIYVNPYTMQPEHADLGVLTEEFGHNFFGLPDLYTTDAQNSIAFWSHFSAGSWGGFLGGAQPVGFPLWFRMIAWCGVDWCNWQEPMLTRSYTDPTADITIGQLEDTPQGLYKGIRINLPPTTESVPNRAGTGKAAYVIGVDGADYRLERSITVSAASGAKAGVATTGLLTFDAFWDIETHYDYGYVQVIDGEQATFLCDMDGVFTTANPNGANLGCGLTGKATAKRTLRFDLSAYAGKTVTLRFRYVADIGTNLPGWWVDNVKLDGTLVDDFERATAPATFPDWTNNGWIVAPYDRSFASYYLIEWRNATRYDRMVKTAYITTDYDVDIWRVERVPYNIPGALIYYRNAKYGQIRSGYSQRPWYPDPPSFGPKNKLLVVDMNYGPLRIPGTASVLSSRSASYDAPLSLQDTEAFTISSIYGVTNPPGPYVFPSKPAVKTFNDALGYYAGFYFGSPCPAGSVCYMNRDGSAVIPARTNYTTRITDFNGNPLYDLYGATVSGHVLGSGNPGDNSAQYGVNVDLISKAEDGSSAVLRVRNYSIVLAATQMPGTITRSGPHRLTYQVVGWNVGNETARNVSINFGLDPKMQLVSLTEANNVGEVWGTSWYLNAAAPGTMVTLTLVADVNLTAADNNSWLSVTLTGFDGQIRRGPNWFDTRVRYYNPLFLPLVLNRFGEP